MELVFSVEEDKRAALAALDVDLEEEGILLVTRKNALPQRLPSERGDGDHLLARHATGLFSTFMGSTITSPC